MTRAGTSRSLSASFFTRNGAFQHGSTLSGPSTLPAPQQRSLFGLSFGKKSSAAEQETAFPRRQPILSQDDLFHPLSKSPIPAMQARGERVRALAPCPVSMARDGVRRPVRFECPDCGWPTHYSEKEWREDPEHGKYVTRLREANEDEHDLRSGREMHEFKLPGPQGFEEVINMSNWDVFFYTRNFTSIETERSRRHVSKLLTFPCTVSGVIHENSPYTKRSSRLTHEGLRSMIALRQTLHPQVGEKPSLDVVRIFVVGARAEATLPPAVWDQLTYCFPGVPLHVFLIGPEAVIPVDPLHPAGPAVSEKDKIDMNAVTGGPQHVSAHKNRLRKANWGVPSRSLVVSEGLTLTTLQCNYEQVHAQLEPFDPYTDVFFAFSPGFGFPSQVAVDEMAQARLEEEQDAKRTKEARETYYAGAAGNQHLRSVEPDAAPAGGDVPAREPPPAVPRYTTDPLTSLTTAPIVQAQREWALAIQQILSTKCALISTGFSPADVERDVLAFESVEGVRGEFEWLITPGENVFASQQWAVADFDPRVAVKANWGLWAVRGKAYPVMYQPNPLEP
ncbi:hypothetical protein K437DRAFT_253945 [Tilletiaria anomala UBC 951]|uniref:Uncharacterized protein n=1 Tax=Tilletiaria anomala (strain ATCC 24038 / CBS 436.72 / UBC 951) TaxID=1037660 RepID=A0A066WP10_TILAU|nr:uncharacterized protein K437DRAFT_253945 [Tilletiaria anomala UBC 951]KDN52744.1 hypothetical protein K437DRAFT_253945 [Tilletiaria anomala UBC 951]